MKQNVLTFILSSKTQKPNYVNNKAICMIQSIIYIIIINNPRSFVMRCNGLPVEVLFIEQDINSINFLI